MLIDGGRAGSYPALRQKLAAIADAGAQLELLVLTHVDADHIEGLLKLATDPHTPILIKDVWFNGFDQMSRLRPMGPAQGDRFSNAIRARGWRWNRHFDGSAVGLTDGEPHLLRLEGGLALTLLSPNLSKLLKMRDAWEDWREEEAAKRKEAELAAARAAPTGLQAMGRKPMPKSLDVDSLAAAAEVADPEPPNGSSIAFIAEWDNRRVLLGADAHPDLVEYSLRKLGQSAGGRYRVELYKVSHHGSIGNTSRALIEQLDCQRFLFSTNGTRHGHPDPESVARLLKFAPAGGKTLYFNYRQPYTLPWQNPSLKKTHQYECCFPQQPGQLTIEI